MKFHEKVFLYLVLVMSLGTIVFLLSKRPGKQVAYIDIGKLVSNYKLKNDMEREGQANLYRIRNVVDSLRLVSRSGNNNGSDSMLQKAETAYEKYYSYLEQEVSTKTWDRLNPLLDEYGKKEGFLLIIGANGRGNILYGSKSIDVTDAVITFVNNRYEKGN